MSTLQTFQLLSDHLTVFQTRNIGFLRSIFRLIGFPSPPRRIPAALSFGTPATSSKLRNRTLLISLTHHDLSIHAEAEGILGNQQPTATDREHK